MSKEIAVYADWVGLPGPTRLGWLHARRGAVREVFEFVFEQSALVKSGLRDIHLDPRLGRFEGRQPPPRAGEFWRFCRFKCRRRSKFEPPCRSNIEPGVEADFCGVGCG